MRHDGRLTELLAAPRGVCGLFVSVAQAYVDTPDIFIVVVGILSRFIDVIPAARNELREGNDLQCLKRMATHFETTKYSASSKIGNKSMTSLNHLLTVITTTTV